MMKMPDFPVLLRDIAPGTAAQVDVLMDFWQADPHGSMEICLQGIWRLLILLPTHAANLSYQGDMSPSKDDMGPHSVAPGPALCRTASLSETFWDAGEGSSLQLHPQASVSVCCFSFFLLLLFFFYLLDLVLFF